MDFILAVKPSGLGVILHIYSLIYKMNTPAPLIIKDDWEIYCCMEIPKDVPGLEYTPSQSVLDCNSLFQFKALHRTQLYLCAEILSEIY